MKLLTAAVATLLLTPAHAQNVLQSPGMVDPPMYDCAMTPGKITNLDLTLSTTGRPVLVMYTIEGISGVYGKITLTPLVNGLQDMTGKLDRYVGNDYPNAGQIMTLHFARVYALPAGTHTFGVQAVCGDSYVHLTQRWMIGYELPEDGNASRGKK